ncbi:MAG: carboxypeptidase regulatory-like domain-containing protein, partial [Planctomycetota bacterium]
GGWYWLRSGQETEEARAEEVALTAVELAPEVNPSVVAGRRELVEVAEPPAVASAPARLVGTVRRRADASPLEGARVRVFAGALGMQEATTDASGAFAFEWSAGATVSLVQVLAGDETTAVQQYLNEPLGPGSSRAVELFVTSGATLAGRVVDASGNPVPGAEVLGWCAERIDDLHLEPDRRVSSGSDGSFTLEHFGESFVVVAEAPGFACKTGLRGELAEGSRVEGLTVELAPALRIEGVVVDEQGRPVEGARLSHDGQDFDSLADQTEVVGVRRFSATRFDVSSGPDGRFEVSPTAEETLSLSVSHTDFLSLYVYLRAATDNRIVLSRGMVITGRVFDAHGRALEGARVRLGDCRGGRATTDADGRWMIGKQEPAESAYLLAQIPGHAIAVLEPVELFEGMPPLELRLAPELALAGRILDARHRPVAGAKLLLVGEREVSIEGTRYNERTTWEWAAGLSRATTDGEGRFRFGALNAGEYALTVVPREGAAPGVPFRLQAGDEALELTLDEAQEGVTFRGRVIDALDRRPLTSFTVTVTSPGLAGWTGRPHTIESADGSYELTGFAPGRHRLGFQAVGHQPVRLEERECASGVTSDTIVLDRALTVGFELTGLDVSMATLTFADLDGRAVHIGFGSGTASSLFLNPGPAVFAVLPQKPLRVTARAPRCRDLEFELDLTTPPLESVPVPLELDPLERVQRTQLGVFLSADPEVRALRTLDGLRAAMEQGKLALPRERIELEFLRADGTRHGVGSLELVEGTTYAWTTILPDEDGELLRLHEEEQGPGLELELPARVTTIRFTGAEVATTEVELEPLLEAEAPVVVLAPRD